MACGCGQREPGWSSLLLTFCTLHCASCPLPAALLHQAGYVIALSQLCQSPPSSNTDKQPTEQPHSGTEWHPSSPPVPPTSPALSRYELHHGVKISDSALVEAAMLSDRYIADRFLPGTHAQKEGQAGCMRSQKPSCLETLLSCLKTPLLMGE